MSTRYKLLFRGEVAKDQHPAVVRGRLQALLKASDAQLEVLFSGKPVSIKKDVDEAAAERYLEAFVNAGAKLEIVELDAQALADMARKAEMVAAAQAHKAQQAKETQEKLLEEVQAASAQHAAPDDADTSQAAAAPVSVPAPGETVIATPAANFALAEVGSDLVPAEAKKPEPVASVSTDHLSLAEPGGNLVEAAEAAAVEPPVPVDTSHLSLDEAGATLGVPTDATPLTEALIEFDFELGEVGDLLVESTAVVVPDIPDLSHFELESMPEPEADPEMA